MESEIQKINTSDAGLGRKMRIYGISNIILSIIMLFVIFIVSFDFMSSLYSTTNPDLISPIMIEYFRSVATWTIIITSIIFIFAIWYTLGIRSLSKITHWRSNLLNKVFTILIVGYICQFGIGIYSISHLFSIANIFSSTIIDWTDTAVLNNYLSQISGSLILVDIIGLFSQGIIFIGYIEFKKWGEGLAEYIPSFSTNNIERAFNFIAIGSGLNILAGLIDLIPDLNLGGWISIVASTLMVIGFIRAGNLLKGGIPTIPAVRSKDYSSFQYYPSSSISPSYDIRTNQPMIPVPPSFNQPTMNIPQTKHTPPQNRVCPVCGQVDLLPDAKFCHNCGRIL